MPVDRAAQKKVLTTIPRFPNPAPSGRIQLNVVSGKVGGVSSRRVWLRPDFGVTALTYGRTFDIDVDFDKHDLQDDSRVAVMSLPGQAIARGSDLRDDA